MEIINTALNKLRMLQYFIAEQTFLNIYTPSTITDTSQVPSTTKLYLSTECAEAFKPHYIGTYIFFLTPSFPIIASDQVKYQLRSVNIGLD